MIIRISIRNFGLAALLLCTCLNVIADECARTDQWRCRVCGWLNPITARYCRRDHADLEAQRRKFKESLAPVLRVSPLQIVASNSVLVRWYTHCASKVSLEPIGEVPAVGTIRIHPKGPLTIKLLISSDWSDWMTEPLPVNVEVVPTNPEIVANASALRIWQGESVGLSWESRNASRVVLNPGARPLPPKGELGITPQESTTFRFTAENEGGTPVTTEVAVDVRSRPISPADSKDEDFEQVFNKLVPIIVFAAKEPTAHNAATLPPSEEVKLQDLLKLLSDNRDIRIAMTAYAYEYWDGRKGNYSQHHQLLKDRWNLVTEFLVSHGVRREQIYDNAGNFGISVPKSAIHTKDQEIKSRAVVFRYVGVQPELTASLEPSNIRRGETAYLIWSSKFADNVSIEPISTSVQRSGMIRVDGNVTSFRIVATNKYNYTAQQLLSLRVEPAEQPRALKPLDVKTYIGDHVTSALFETRTARLTENGRGVLTEDAKWLLAPDRQQYRVVVHGNVATGESDTLGRLRAEETVRYLVTLGIARQRIRIVAAPLEQEDYVTDLPLQAVRAFAPRADIAYDDGSLPDLPRRQVRHKRR